MIIEAIVAALARRMALTEGLFEGDARKAITEALARGRATVEFDGTCFRLRIIEQ